MRSVLGIKYNVIVYDSAYRDVKSVYDFCKFKYGIEYAEKIINKIKQEIYLLQNFPLSRPTYFVSKELVFKKKIVNKRYLVIFSVFKNSINIYYVYDGRRNIVPKDLFKV